MERRELRGYWAGERRTCGLRWTNGAVVNPEIRDGKARAERRQGPWEKEQDTSKCRRRAGVWEDTGMPRVSAHERGWSCWHLQELHGLSAYIHREKCVLPSSSSFHHCVKCDLEFINYPQKISDTAGSIFGLSGSSCAIH